MTIRRMAMQASTANLAASKAVLVDANGLLIDGTMPDANNRIPTAMMPSSELSHYFHASFDEHTNVSGTFQQSSDASQTDFDSSLSQTAGYMRQTGASSNLEEVHFGSITLNAGTYKISFSYLRYTDAGILEVLIGTTSLGTQDMYGASQYNTVGSFTYSPTTRVTANLRVRTNGKNASSTGYSMYLGRLEIIRTG